MKTFPLIISSPDGDLFRGEVEKLILRGTEGDLAVLAGHVPFVTAIRKGRCVVEDGEGRRIQAPELFGTAALQDRPQMKVHDIAPEEDEVRLLRVDEVHPARELGLPVAVTHMEVAGKDHRQGLLHRLFRPDGQQVPEKRRKP